MLIGCQKQQPFTPVEREISGVPGKFAVSWMTGLSKSSTLPKAAINSPEFDLGYLKGSSHFYFLIYNIGEMPITDIKLSISDSSFLVNPSMIDSLPPGGERGMLPVIRVTALHGSAIDGPGFRPVMKPGPNNCTLSISGITKTTEGKDTTASMSVMLKVFALVMDLEMRGDSGRVIDLADPNGGGAGTLRLDGYDVLNCRGYNFSDETYTFINTGNVPVILKSYESINSTMISNLSKTLEQGDSVSVDLTPVTFLYFSLNGNNTVVADYSKLRMSDNGLCYFRLYRPPQL